MKDYIYKGKCEHCATIRTGKDLTDLRLQSGGKYSLPSDHPHVKSLVASGLLKEAK